MQAMANRLADTHCAQPWSSQKQATTSGMAAMRDSVSRSGRLSIGPSFLATAPEVVMDFLGERVSDARYRLDVFKGGDRHCPSAAEMVQQCTVAVGADARHFVERRPGDVGRAHGPMRADGEAVRFVSQPLQEVEHWIARFE